jgi:hypothetical protein
MQPASIDILAGECRVYFAFEVAFSIDLARAALRFPESAREALPPRRSTSRCDSRR